jgi:uncharacterized protein (DUF433 family)
LGDAGRRVEALLSAKGGWICPVERVTSSDYGSFMKPHRLDRIAADPLRLNGQPCLRNLRLTVRRVLEIAALYPDRAERLKVFPEIEDEDISQALHYAALFRLIRKVSA